MQRKRLGEILIEAGIITPQQLTQALEMQRTQKRLLGQILVEMGWSTEEEVCQAVATILKLDYVHLDNALISQDIIQLTPEPLAVQRNVLPLFIQDQTLYLAMENPLDIETIHRIEHCTGMQVKPLIALPSQLRETIKRHYTLEDYVGDMLQQVHADDELLHVHNGHRLDKLIRLILIKAIKHQAECHIELSEHGVIIHYPTASQKNLRLPQWLYTPLMKRLKTIAGGEDLVIRRYAQQPQPTSCRQCGATLQPEWHVCPFCSTAKTPQPLPEPPTTPLIVAADDEAPVRDLVRTLLEHHGYQVISAVDGEDALTKVRAELPNLVILDVVMPKLDGFAVCQQLRANVETMFTPVIMLTAQDSIEEKLRGLRLGADDYITKPFNAQELLARIEMVLRRTQQIKHE